MADLENAWKRLTSDVKQCKLIDNMLSAKTNSIPIEKLRERTVQVVDELEEAYLDYLSKRPVEDLSDEKIQAISKYTEGLPLKDYENALDLVPELVNLVSLADALPLDGSSLPFDLKKIAVRCKGAVYFAPRRFTAVQLAFDEPRSRVLLFHTGRVVGTGCNNPTAAKVAIARALKTISIEAHVHVGIRRFAVINQVGAIALGAKLNCDGFADTHSSTAHYDPKSFVGLAWRPVSECICSEIYSTGKSNLPGSRRERQLLRSFARMAPELLRHSEKPELAERFTEKLRRAHRPDGHTRQAPRATDRATIVVSKEKSLWDDEDDDDGRNFKVQKHGKKGPITFEDMCEDDENAFGDVFDCF